MACAACDDGSSRFCALTGLPHPDVASPPAGGVAPCADRRGAGVREAAARAAAAAAAALVAAESCGTLLSRVLCASGLATLYAAHWAKEADIAAVLGPEAARALKREAQIKKLGRAAKLALATQ